MSHRNRLETKHLFLHCGKLAGLAVLNADPLKSMSWAFIRAGNGMVWVRL